MKYMVNNTSGWPLEEDAIFSISERAQVREAEIGKENVINATIGVLADDDGKLVTMESVYNTFKSLDNAEISAYAPIVGTPGYLKAIQNVCFMGNEPDAEFKIVSTPGGTGAIKLAIANYVDRGNYILTSDWHWGAYSTIAEEHGAKLTTYTLFDENRKFNIEAFKNKCDEILENQDRLFVIINTPGHNPTGYTVSDKEWDKILDYAEALPKNKKIILFVDVAYIDYVKDDISSRKFFRKFSGLSQNILIVVSFSMSKGYTAYGMRMGAAIGISSKKEVVDEFYYSLMHTCRANWSNGNHAAMATLEQINSNKDKKEIYDKEKNKYKQLVIKRAHVFVKEAEKCNLNILPYIDGFFISIPCENPEEVCERLIKEDLYLIPMKMGLRFAVCSVSEEKCMKSPKIIKKVLEQF